MADFVINADAIVTELAGGAVRRVLSHTEEMMVVEITFPSGSIGGLHSHPHVQSSYVKSGVFEYQVGEEKYIMREGDSITVEGDAMHGCTCVEEGVLLDVFTPERKDFL